jgi:NADH-quinone oxidoreductase subunit A
MTALVGCLLVFLAISIFFVFIHLVIGKLIRPSKPDAEKLTIYECGEPTIGSAWIQFDLRFYVVALLFVIFDVEVAFFFPWAVVFGKANTLSQEALPVEQRIALTNELAPPYPAEASRRKEFERLLREPGTERERAEGARKARDNQRAAAALAGLSFWDIVVFFGVLLVGYAYLWKRGDLDWVRSVAAEVAASENRPRPTPVRTEREPLVGAGV